MVKPWELGVKRVKGKRGKGEKGKRGRGEKGKGTAFHFQLFCVVLCAFA
jgi:hypothetical protein